MDILSNNRDITQLSNYKTPARAEYFLHIKSVGEADKIFSALEYMKEKELPYIIVTGGTNSLFAFETYPGLVIYIDIQGWTYDIDTKILTCSAGDKIWDIAASLETQYRQDIWHRFIGLPGSMAGAIYGNAGCFGLETESNFLDVEVLCLESGNIRSFSKDDMHFSYRSSRLKEEKKYCILSARFDLSEKREKYSSTVDNIKFREEIQPKGYSCGSFFKNPKIDREAFCQQYPQLQDSCPKQISAGFLIEQVGLKGYKAGGAYFSDLHANFLMHDGTGSYTDLLNLIHLAQKKVHEAFEIELENEVQIIE